MKIKTLLSNLIVLPATLALLAACANYGDTIEEEFNKTERGVFVLCEGNYNSGNASLSFYNPNTRSVENGVFKRANDRKLGDTGQSITIQDGVAYVAVENSGIVWAIDTKTLRVRGQLTTSQTEHMVNPRYVHLVSKTKAYISDLCSPYITIFNPQTLTYTGSISTGQTITNGYANTEQMIQSGRYVFTNCWCYSRSILVVDTETDEVCDSIVLSTWQPKSMVLDYRKKLWVVTDGGYNAGSESFGQNIPHLYRIDTETREVELDLPLQTDESTVHLAINPSANILYLLNNDIYQMNVNDTELPSNPFIQAPVDNDGKRHKLYGMDVDPKTGDIYVADAVDYAQSGVAYRYTEGGVLIDEFRVGINPNGFAFSNGDTDVPEEEEEEEKDNHSLVSKVFEFMPAPGHQVNGYKIVGDFIHANATMEEACQTALEHFQKEWMVSLGAQGGYIVAGFDHNVTNSHGGDDLIVMGNPYSYQSEPGIVWVMQDENGDGLPNDTWYELAGSEYGTENETLDYAITYYKPTGAQQDIRWKDNMGNEGIVPYMSAWNTHDSYWQDWVETEVTPEGECRTYYGSRLKDKHTYVDGVSDMPAYGWGYADNGGSDCKSRKIYLKLSNAVKRDGTPANLDYINFVKIQTAQTGWTPNLGEISTEVYGIWDAHK